ncbi:MAG: hypothetical protein D5R99_08760 [Methanocalculus sp. MSAO_Arc1]|uniref:DUF7504 family protein n=1 Tax=Methanocalculus TaxID=71151 RepID=UPI000FF265D7|nr:MULTISPECIES: hypothetical protein [unclassified Methanocalculus]MCP1661458.1 hypothetical protein [Methanocalculus sp. AMF5]RQD79273.1 MAG: hypothetical protein D5R99_08760 [Methanocalculus sp. MSAO_Arc1]
MPPIHEILSDAEIVIALSTSSGMRKDVIHRIGELQSAGYSGIIISINEPSSIMKKSLEKQSIESQNLFFIDCITGMATGQKKDEGTTIYVASPGQLTNIGIALTKAMSSMKGRDNLFLLIDSVNTMFVYNEPDHIIRFLHMLINKVRLNSAKGILFSVKNAIDPIVSTQIETFSDTVIHVGDEEAAA